MAIGVDVEPFLFENLPKGGFATKIRFYRGFDAPGDETGGEGAQILYGIDAVRFVAAIALPGGVNSRTGWDGFAGRLVRRARFGAGWLLLSP